MYPISVDSPPSPVKSNDDSDEDEFYDCDDDKKTAAVKAETDSTLPVWVGKPGRNSPM
jgi:hypothetical protein